jgi:hypothetical protein
MLKRNYSFLALAIFMVAGFILSGNVHADDPEKRTTNTGHDFIRDISHPKLGEAWRDESGLIWGDIMKNGDGSVRKMVQSSEYMKQIGRPLPDGRLGAKEYCESIGARLPSEVEFTQLREYMGARSGRYEEYSHHDDKILPNLKNYRFWSSSVDPNPNYSDYAFAFGGYNGDIFYYYRSRVSAVRCVVGR